MNPDIEAPPPHLNLDLRNRWSAIMRTTLDPTRSSQSDGTKVLVCKKVHAVFEADEYERKTEVLYIGEHGAPMTAFFLGCVLLYVTEGW